MSKHQITIELELTEAGEGQSAETLDAIVEGMIRNACEDYGIVSYDYGTPQGSGGFDGPFVTSARRIQAPTVPEDLTEGLTWWTGRHPEDVVAMTDDNQDALVLSERSGAQMGVVWVDPSGLVRIIEGPWRTLHRVKDLESSAE